MQKQTPRPPRLRGALEAFPVSIRRVLTLVVAIVALVVLAIAHVLFWSWVYRVRPQQDELRYATTKATVTLAFRRRDVATPDILAALDEVREQATRASADRAAEG